MRKLLPFLILVLCLTVVSACADTTLMVVSDTHFLAPELYEGSDLFLRAMAQGDGKVVQESPALLTALINQARRLHPDALILTGDLAFNGELKSHEWLAEGLQLLLDEGIQVYVIPGNHDINVQTARVFIGDTWTYAEQTRTAAFARIYKPFMKPLERADVGFSYTVDIGTNIRLFFLDCAIYEPMAYTNAIFDDALLEYTQDVLAKAHNDGKQLISFSHHSLIPHSSLWQESFVIQPNQPLRDLLVSAQVPVHFSGHLHIQHISHDGIYDIASGAYSVFPHRYGLVTLSDDGTISYTAQPVDEDLLPDQFMSMSEAFFRDLTRNKSEANLAQLDIPEAEMESMLDYAANLNVAYFSGALRADDVDVWKSDASYLLWKRYSDTVFFSQYVDLILSEASDDALSLTLFTKAQ